MKEIALPVDPLGFISQSRRFNEERYIYIMEFPRLWNAVQMDVNFW